jgi:hypothetical protein
MRAFIVRPFGKKTDLKDREIDFDKVADELIAPALQAVGASGRETLDIVQSGNIRVDMFRRLLTADLVVADLSIHNANVFYEIGIRHALRSHGTLMLRCNADAFPFDLQTDRYFTYDRDNPSASVPGLIKSLQAIKAQIAKDYTAKDSPVFASLPNLTEPEPSLFNPVPQDFGEEVARAVQNGWSGDLALISHEVKGFEWENRAWRAVGTAQFEMDALIGARTTWEYIRKLEPEDLEANLKLGTIYERLSDLVKSTEALTRALGNKEIERRDRAEAYSLLARNFKTRWRNEWESKPKDIRSAEALRSPHLQESFENYERAFDEDLNHFYSGLNALAMLKIMIALAESMPEVWSEQYPSDKKASEALDDYREHAVKLVSAVELSLKAYSRRLEREDKKDVWYDISEADLMCLTSTSPARVAAAYRRALLLAPDFNDLAISSQLKIYRDLEVLNANLTEVFKVVKEPASLPESGRLPRDTSQKNRVLLFAGHRIDRPNRPTPRFPASSETSVREKIKASVVKEMNLGIGVSCGYAGGANGGDIIFHEVCAELGIPTRLYLAMPLARFVVKSVDDGGSEWVQRFWNLYHSLAGKGQVRVLSEVEDADADYNFLPAWLWEKEGYNIWQRNNLWMLFNALDEACDPASSDPNLTLIALWDGGREDGPGGTADLVNKVEGIGARHEVIRPGN